jgi:hypothetical protein
MGQGDIWSGKLLNKLFDRSRDYKVSVWSKERFGEDGGIGEAKS